MNNDLEKKLNEVRDSINLTKTEKDGIRGFLISYIKAHPMESYGTLLSNTFWLFRPVPALAALILVLTSGAGISMAAESSLPGDVLYPIKVQVNEEVRGMFARSDEARVAFLIDVTERRLEETEQLAAENRLDSKAKDQIAESFNESAGELNDTLEALKDKENLNISANATSKIESSLMAHQDVLTQMAEENGDSKDQIHDVLNDIKNVSDKIKEVRKNFDGDVLAKKESSLRLATEARLEASVESIDDAKKVLKEGEGSLDDETRKKAESMIHEAEEIVDRVRKEGEDTSTSTSTNEDAIISLKSLSIIASSTATSTDDGNLSRLHRAILLSNQAKIMLETVLKLNIKVLDFTSSNVIDTAI